MESYFSPSIEDLRISNSPRRSPQITELTSPPRSVHPQLQQMDSIHTQTDYGLRTTDFFDDTSDDDSAKGVSAHQEAFENEVPALTSKGNKKRRSDPPAEPLASQGATSASGAKRLDNEGYQPLIASTAQEDDNSSSLVGSIDELLPGGGSSPPQFPDRLGKASIRSSSRIEDPRDRTSRIDQTLGAYAIAHEITLQSLMRDESTLDKSLQSFPPHSGQSRNRHSFLLPSLHRQSHLRIPQTRPVSLPPNDAKKVHVVPPPIDTSAPRRSLPEDIVRTPYPFSLESAHRKTASGAKSWIHHDKPSVTSESVLTVSIRQSNPNSRYRITNLTIPASNDFSVVRSHSPRSKEQHFKALDFDDAMLFQQLRKRYRELMGPMRILSARSLRRISVAGVAMKEADQRYWLHPPRSPQGIVLRALSGSFSEDRIMQYYREPALGKSRYAFVHWAHRLAAAPPVRTPQPEKDKENTTMVISCVSNQPEGLEFVVGWSVARIAIAVLLVLCISTAATLLWVFLGHVSTMQPEDGGYRGAGDRVTSGVVMGICLLLLGGTGIAGWLGISWLVM